jgi:hypothetical protein
MEHEYYAFVKEAGAAVQSVTEAVRHTMKHSLRIIFSVLSLFTGFASCTPIVTGKPNPTSNQMRLRLVGVLSPQHSMTMPRQPHSEACCL